MTLLSFTAIVFATLFFILQHQLHQFGLTHPQAGDYTHSQLILIVEFIPINYFHSINSHTYAHTPHSNVNVYKCEVFTLMHCDNAKCDLSLSVTLFHFLVHLHLHEGR